MNRFKAYIQRLTNISDHTDIPAAVSNIKGNINFRGPNVWILVFSIIIASVGLNVNSIPVIIGAMLISPLMGPIFGLGLGLGTNDTALIRDSLKNLVIMIVISVIASCLYFLISPLDLDKPTELLARTNPTIYDVLIALFGGFAGIFEISRKEKGTVMSGVAIATALMPPLCTAGFGIATGNMAYFLGAFYLFFINTVFISLSTYIGVRMMKFKQKQFATPERYARVRRYIIIAVAATMAPAVVMTYNIVKKSVFNTNVSNFIADKIDNAGTRVVAYDVSRDSMTLRVVAVGRELSDSAIRKAENEMVDYKLGGYRLQVIQGSETDSVMMLNNRLAGLRTSTDNYAAMLRDEAVKAARLQELLGEYTRYEAMAPEIAKEVKALFPTTASVSLSLASEATADTSAVKRYATAIIGTVPGSNLDAAERRRISQWLETRLGVDTIKLVVE